MDYDHLKSIAATTVGDDFEDQFWALLRRKYSQQDLVYIPADLGGDYGIEGFSADGVVYQCYADKDSTSLRARTDKQKAKLTTDTSKLKKNSSKLESLLGGTVVRHYFFCVPQYHAAELVAHAAMRSEVVRGFELPWIAEDFSIRIKVPDDYPVELRALTLDGTQAARLPPEAVRGAEVEGLDSGDSDLMDNLRTKLAVLKQAHPSTNTEELRMQFVRAYLDRVQLLNYFEDWPDVYESIETQRRSRQTILEFDSALASDAPVLQLSTVFREYADQLETHCASVSAVDATRLSRGQVADWLMRCPLNFSIPEVADGD